MESLGLYLIEKFNIEGSFAQNITLLVLMITFSLIVLTWFLLFAGITSWVERRIAGRMQCRPGPNVNGPEGFLQWLMDAIKPMEKEDLMPDGADKWMFKVAPYFVFMGVGSTLLVIPYSESLILGDLNIGIFYAVAITSLATIGILLAGWSSNNKWSLIGGVRAASQMISYEVPNSLSILAVVLLTGSLSMQDIVLEQGAYPWQWNISHSPFMLASFFIFFISSLAEGSRTPFDLPEGESELVSGYNTEYSGIRFAVFFLAEWGNLFVMAALSTILFLGGWASPFAFESIYLTNFIQVLIFLSKVFILVFIIIQLRWTLPRVRIDQLMTICWTYFVPISLVVVLFTAIWMNFFPRTDSFSFQTLVQIITMLMWMYMIFYVIVKAFKNRKLTEEK